MYFKDDESRFVVTFSYHLGHGHDQKVKTSEIPSVVEKSRFDWLILLALKTISNGELSDPLCESVNN